MKRNNIIKRTICLMIALLIPVLMVGCSEDTPKSVNAVPAEKKEASLWGNATYTEDKTFGSGAKTFELEVKAEDKSVTFTIKTDADNLEDALTENKLVEGEEGAYGLYIKKVNGITADYDVDQSFWSLSQNGTPLSTGASGAEIKGGEHFEFTHTK